MSLTEILFLLPLTLLTVPVLVFTVQVVCALLPYTHQPIPAVRRGALVVLVPAHNEAAGISATLASIQTQLEQGDRVLVVADNCSDATAATARAAGAETIERRDAIRRGKGYALDFGVRHLAAAPPEVVIIIDADCQVQAGTLNRLARLCNQTQRPVQALYLMYSPPNAGLQTKVAEFAWIVKNQARALGFLRLGLPCQLMGTGMAFPWRLLQQMDLATGHLVEDLKLGLECARRGRPALFCPEACVTSIFPQNSAGAHTQRTRWEHGHLSVLFKDAPGLLLESLYTLNLRLLALALDLCVPPLALLTLLVYGFALCGLAIGWVTGSAWPWNLAGFVPLVLGLAVWLAWLKFGRAILSLTELIYAPAYVISKIPLYCKFFMRRQVEWVRSRRDEP